MGLICDFTTPGGLTAVGAYHRIENIHVDLRKAEEGVGDGKTSCFIYWSIEISKDKDARDAEMPLIGSTTLGAEVDLENTEANQFNIVKAGYEYMKTLDEYDGATDA